MSIRSILNLVGDQNKIVTPAYIRWLASNPDIVYGLHTPKTVLDPPPAMVPVLSSLLSIPRQRVGTFSASSAGYCIRRQQLAYLGMPATKGHYQSPILTNVFNDGKWRHLRWQSNLLLAKILEEIERRYDWPNMHAVGTIDGRGIVPSDHPRSDWRDEEFGFELKGVTPFLYPRWVKARFPIDHHMAQIHRYFLMTGLRLFVVLYENKATNDFHEWVIRPIPMWMNRAKVELLELNRGVQQRELTPPLLMCKARKGPEWDGCQFSGVNGTCEISKSWPRQLKTA